MSESKKFDPAKLAKLNDPERLHYLYPELLWEKLALDHPDTLVDIGAGTGFFASIFGRKLKSGKVYACDISEVMLEWMKNNLPPETKSLIVPIKMEETSVPLPDGMADLVYMINLHHELEDPLSVVAEAARLLKKEGKLMILDWKKEETPQGPPREIRVEAETIMTQMKLCGFSNILNHCILPYHHFVVGEKK